MMNFDEWFHKHCEPIDLQIEQMIENNERLDMSAKIYRDDLKEAFEAGIHSDVHTDNSKVIAELKTEVETWKKASELNSYKAHKLGERVNQLLKDKGNLIDENNKLKKQIEKMKTDVMANIKWADKNCDNMWQKLVKMWNEWENKYGK